MGDGGGAGVIEVSTEGLAGLLTASSAVGRAPELGVGPDTVIAISDEGGVTGRLLGVDGELARKDVDVGLEACGGDDGVAVVDESHAKVEQADIGIVSTGLNATTVDSRNEQTREYNERLHI